MGNKRLIFPELNLFKKELTERFLTATRAIYENHPVYTYNDDDSKTGLQIYPSYGNPTDHGKQPRFIIKAGGYQKGFNDMLNNNMSGYATDSTGAIVGTKYFKMISPTIVVLVHAFTEEESSDLADELADICLFACKSMYSELGLIMNGAQVSETDEYRGDKGIYQTTVQFIIDVPWENTKSTGDTEEIIVNPEIEPPDPDDEISDYRPPGVGAVVQDKNARTGYLDIEGNRKESENPNGMLPYEVESPGIRVYQEWVEGNSNK
jgi:hypothetical protein